MTKAHATEGAADATWKHASTRTITAGGVTFAYREFGPRGGVPLVFLNRAGRRHEVGVLDQDGLGHAAAEREHEAMRAQLIAIRAAGVRPPHDLGKVHQPVLVANGDHDLMVASAKSTELARALPHAPVMWSQLDRAERSPAVTVALSTIFAGGPVRLWSWRQRGRPHPVAVSAIVLETLGVPVLIAWQRSVSIRAVEQG